MIQMYHFKCWCTYRCLSSEVVWYHPLGRCLHSFVNQNVFPYSN